VKEHIGLPKDSDQLGWHMPGQQVLDAWLSFLDTPAVTQLFVSTVRSISLRFSLSETRWPPRNKDDTFVFQDDTPLPLLVLHLRRGD